MTMYNMSCNHIRQACLNITFICDERALQNKNFHIVQNFVVGKIFYLFLKTFSLSSDVIF